MKTASIYVTGGEESYSWQQLVENDFGLDPDWKALLGERQIDRVYIGAELCDRLLLSKQETIEMTAKLLDRGLRVTYMTPPVGEKGLKDVTRLLEALPHEVEVLFGDWGVARRAYTLGLTNLVLGRVLVKTLRDPRVLPMVDESNKDKLGRCSVELEAFRALLEENRVKRVEFDNTAIGLSPLRENLSCSIHLPMAPVVRSKICHAAPQTFLGKNCMRECERDDMDVLMRDPKQPATTYIQRGNAVFYMQPKAKIQEGLAWAEQQDARVVVSQEVML